MTAVNESRTAARHAPIAGDLAARTEPVSLPERIPSRPAGAAPRNSRTLEMRKAWERRIRRRVRWTDIAFVALATSIAGAFSTTAPAIAAQPYLLFLIPSITMAVWVVSLEIANRHGSAIGTGSTEYRRVLQASGLAFGVLAMTFILVQQTGFRTQILIALPIGLVSIMLGRWGWRRWLCVRRSYGQYLSRAIVVGEREDVEYVLRKLRGRMDLGYLVVGTALADADDDVDALTVDDVRYGIVGDIYKVAEAAELLHADSVIVAGNPSDDAAYVKRLAWELEGTAADLVLSSRIADVAGPRMSLSPLDGLPLIHVRIPTFEGGAYLFKRVFDVATSLVALILFAPIAAIIAIAIKVDSRGPVFFRQTRIGRDGRAFEMMKFRSMRTNAEAELAVLMETNEGAGPLFKMKSDPRVTRVGRILRRYSIDEVPQFWNVLIGDMSIVGPRPPLAREVTAYNGQVFRRLYIKPGITGPWQVGGRSDLSWEESVRLDLRYVENWSVMEDLIIMWRTVKVMIRPAGAY